LACHTVPRYLCLVGSVFNTCVSYDDDGNKKQAAYSLVTASEKPAVHLRIGRLLLARTHLPSDFEHTVTFPEDEQQSSAANTHEYSPFNPTTAITPSVTTETKTGLIDGMTAAVESMHSKQDKEGESLLDVVRHLNRGQMLVTKTSERWQLAMLNCYVAARTRESTAFKPALIFALYAMIFIAPATAVIEEPPSPLTPLTPITPGSKGSLDSKQVTDDVDAAPAPVSPNSNTITTTSSTNDIDTNNDTNDLLVQPSSAYDYDANVPKTIWTNSKQVRIVTRIYWLRLALEYSCYHETHGDAFTKVALLRAPNSLDRARILNTQMYSMVLRTDYKGALTVGKQALTELGFQVPPIDDFPAFAASNLKSVMERVKDKAIDATVAALPTVTTPQDRLLAEVGLVPSSL
jgi:hypothetical protein